MKVNGIIQDAGTWQQICSDGRMVQRVCQLRLVIPVLVRLLYSTGEPKGRAADSGLDGWNEVTFVLPATFGANKLVTMLYKIVSVISFSIRLCVYGR